MRVTLDVLLVPLGGGGLLSGCAIAARAFNPKCTIIGVEPEAGNDGQRSFRTGTIVHIDVPQTIADGAQTQHLGSHTFAVIRRVSGRRDYGQRCRNWWKRCAFSPAA